MPKQRNGHLILLPEDCNCKSGEYCDVCDLGAEVCTVCGASGQGLLNPCKESASSQAKQHDQFFKDLTEMLVKHEVCKTCNTPVEILATHLNNVLVCLVGTLSARDDYCREMGSLVPQQKEDSDG